MNLRIMCKWKLMVTLVLLSGVLFSGTAISAEEKITITLLAKEAPELAAVRGAAKSYMQIHPNATIRILSLGRTGYFERISTQLLAKTPAVDIVNFTNIEVGKFAAAGFLAPLNEYINNPKLNNLGFSPDNFSPLALESGKLGGKTYAFPYFTSTLLLFYRKDLIADPPKTWDEYVETAKRFTRSINPDSPTEFGTTMQAKRGSVPPKEWSGVLWSHGGRFLEDGRAAVNTEAGVKALTLWVDMLNEWKVVPPDATSYEYMQVLQAFQQGLVPMCIQWDAAGGTFANPDKSPKIAGKIGATLIAGVKQSDGSILRVPYIQSWTLAVNEYSNVKEGAYEFLSYFLTPAIFEENLVPGMSTSLTPVAESKKFKQANPFWQPYFESLKLGRSFPTSPKISDIQSIVDEAIARALAKEVSPKQALDEAATKINKVLGE